MRVWLALVLIAAMGERAVPPAAQVEERRTVWSGIYTAEQAARGAVAFNAECRHCHGADLGGGEGPALVDVQFMRDWSGRTVGSLFEYIRRGMPEETPSSVSDEDKLDILAFVFQRNGFPAGAEALTNDPARLGRIMIEGREGPTPPPVGATVASTGCVARDARGAWILEHASEPVRTTLDAPPAGAAGALGTLTLQLIGATGIDAYLHQRIDVVGLMIRSKGGDGLNVLRMTAAGPGCPAR